MGGFGSAIVEFMTDNGYKSKVKRLGIPDEIIEHGTQLELHKQCGFDPEGIYQSALQLIDESVSTIK
jgi:1-deoxy-D-xylulose-5-phosphate synthase